MVDAAAVIGWLVAVCSEEAGIGIGGVVGHRAAVPSGDGGAGRRAVSEVAREVGVSRQSLHAWVRALSRGGPGRAGGSLAPAAVESASGVGGAGGGGLRAAPGASEVGCAADRARADARPGAAGAVAVALDGAIASWSATAWSSRGRGASGARTTCVGSGRRRCSSGSWTSSTGRCSSTLVTGELREARIVTGVDDHSRYCVLARVVERATGRAICLAFSEALERYGAPEEVLTDNGKQFTGRFGRGGEVLFDKICRRNAITHRLTAPRSPTTTGKIERFHQTLRRELLDDARPFASLLEAQAALDDWVRDYNAERPHQALEQRAPVTPAERFAARSGRAARAAGAVAAGQPGGGPGAAAHTRAPSARSTPAPTRAVLEGGPVEFDRVVPPSGNLMVCQRQFWLGPRGPGRRCASGPASTSSISRSTAPASRACARTSAPATSPSSRAEGAAPAGPPPLPLDEDGAAIEVDRAVNNSGLVGLAGQADPRRRDPRRPAGDRPRRTRRR